ncbi:hypothetical protein CMT22_17895 [Elizabethkingia anophelis]|nr:hypothetical protein [Elizabethkingia anophelis]
METFYILFETDIHKTRRSRIFLGIFSSSKLAEISAKKKNCYTSFTTADIVPVQLNRIGEI